MACVHLRQLFKLCQEHDIKLGGSDLIHVVCNQCGEQEVCPATLTDEYDAKMSRHTRDKATADKRQAETRSADRSSAD